MKYQPTYAPLLLPTVSENEEFGSPRTSYIRTLADYFDYDIRYDLSLRLKAVLDKFCSYGFTYNSTNHNLLSFGNADVVIVHKGKDKWEFDGTVNLENGKSHRFIVNTRGVGVELNDFLNVTREDLKERKTALLDELNDFSHRLGIPTPLLESVVLNHNRYYSRGMIRDVYTSFNIGSVNEGKEYNTCLRVDLKGGIVLLSKFDMSSYYDGVIRIGLKKRLTVRCNVVKWLLTL